MDLKNNSNESRNSFFKRNRKMLRRVVSLAIVLVIMIAARKASTVVQGKGYNGLWDFTTTVVSNYWKGMDAHPDNLSIEIKEKDFKFLEKNRKQALERGVIINDLDGDFVPAELEYKGKKIKVKLRLKGHMTDHLQNDKWSFRIKVKDKDSFMGMNRFSIQHPGTRGYIYEWIYHELMRREGLIALRYQFINVTVNGRDWGVYAVEENFDDELIENNERKRGPILRFNPNLYWAHRYNMMQRLSSDDEYASYYSANPEAYREDKVLHDSVQRAYYLKSIALVEGFRNKKLSLNQVFDVESLAKFHALIDLVGGENSIDWSDVKYYYNPVTALLEPVAYESFTNFPIHNISGAYKYTEIDSTGNFKDWHTAIFSDPLFYKAYVKNLERVSSPDYLNKFFNESNTALNENLAIVYKEFPYKKFETKGYYKNQAMIRKVLEAPKSFHAYYERISDRKICLKIGSIESLPVTVTSILVSGKEAQPIGQIILPAKQPGEFVHYNNYLFELPEGVTEKDSAWKEAIALKYSVLGSSVSHQEKVFAFPHTDNEFIAGDLKNKKGNLEEFDFLNVDESDKSVTIKFPKVVLSKDLVIPAGYEFVIDAGQLIDIRNHAKIISYSAFTMNGSSEEPVVISSGDSTAQGIEMINAPGSVFTNVIVRNLPKIHDEQWKRSAAILFYESSATFNDCSFYNCKAEDAVGFIRSNFSFERCLFHDMKDDAIDIDYSTGSLAHCVFENCSENALDVTMGKIKVSAVTVNGAGNKAFNVKAGTQLDGANVRIRNANIAISAEDMSNISLQQVLISDSNIGLVGYKNKPGAGHPSISIQGLKFENVKKKYLKEKKSTMVLNGITADEYVDDVEIIIKGDKKKK